MERKAGNEDAIPQMQDRASSEHGKERVAQSNAEERNQTDASAVDNSRANPSQQEKSTKLGVLQNVMNTPIPSVAKTTDVIERTPKGKPPNRIPVLKVMPV